MKTATELQRDILAELDWEPSVDAGGIGVSVGESVVTLTGHVPTYMEKLAAARAVKRLHGVRAVMNELEIQLAPDHERDDAEIARAAARALEWNVQVPVERITVTLERGWLTLEGEVDWYYQKEAAARTTRQLVGIKGLTNLIKVRPKITPAEIESRIREALRRNADLDAQHIRVELDRGRAILSGLVQSWAEREEAERCTWSARGVSSVENHVEVEARLLAPF